MKMFRSILFLAACLALPASAFAQFTSVSGTVTDPNGIPYTGTITAVLTPATPGGYRLQGQPYAGTLSLSSLDNTGHFNVSMGDNGVILPAGSSWTFTVCSNPGGIAPPLGTGNQCFTANVTITGASQDVTAALRAAALNLTTFGGGGGIVTSVSGNAPIVSSGGAAPVISCPTCITGTLAATQIPVATAAQTVAGSNAFTFATGGGISTLSVGGANNFLATNPGANTFLISASASSTNGEFDVNVGVNTLLRLNLSGGVPLLGIFGGIAVPGGRSFGLGTDCTNGATSGQVCIGPNPVAGIPNPIYWPILTAGVNYVLASDGGNPQQTFWTPQTSGSNFGTAPTTPNISFLACDTPSGGVAALGFCWPGTPGRTVAGASDTILSTDRAGCALYTNGGAVAVTSPGLGADPFAHNFEFCAKGATSTAITITPSSGQIAGNNGTLGANLAMRPSATAWCYAWDNANAQCTVTPGIGTTNTLQKAAQNAGGFADSTVVDDGTNPVKSPDGLDVVTNSYDVEIANNTVTGTTVSRLACNDGTGKVIICPSASSITNQAIGTVSAGAGTTGNAVLCIIGFCTVTFDNASTAGHYAIASSTVNGDLHDAGVSLTSGQPNYLVWTSNAGAGTASQYRLLIGDDFVTGSNTGVTKTGSPANGNLTQFSGPNSITNGNLSGDVSTTNTLVTTLAAKYKTWQECNGQGLGDGLNAIPAGTYLEFACWNDTGATVTITGLSCWTNNNGTSTMQVANNAGTNLLTGAVTCTNVKSTGGAAGTQSATVTLPNGDAANFTFVSDGATLRTSWFVKGTF